MSRTHRATSAVSLLLICLGGVAQAQSAAARRLTTVDALRQFPGYYHLQNVLLRGEFVEHGARVALRADEHEVDVLLAEGLSTRTGLMEVRAQVIDVGRLEPGDPRLARYDGAKDAERWPRPGEEMLVSVSAFTEVQAASEASVRALALEPWRFDGQAVTVTGQFRGRNLFADLAGSPAKSSFDFVVRAADASVWITGLRPRGKGFDLNVETRIDTSRWVRVTGVVKRERTLVTIQASRIEPAQPPAARVDAADTAPPAPPLMPGSVIFSSPTPDEVDIPAASPVRLQFSRGIDPSTLAGHIRVSYMGKDAPPGDLSFKTSYDAGPRAVEIRFAAPLERFQTVIVETLEGLKTFDGAPVTPFKLTFSVGE